MGLELRLEVIGNETATTSRWERTCHWMIVGMEEVLDGCGFESPLDNVGKGNVIGWRWVQNALDDSGNGNVTVVWWEWKCQ